MAKSPIHLSEFGEMASGTWQWLEKTIPAVQIPIFAIMPNHVHAIICLAEFGTGGLQTAHTPRKEWSKPLGRIVGAYKTHSTPD
jgi:putative transposase